MVAGGHGDNDIGVDNVSLHGHIDGRLHDGIDLHSCDGGEDSAQPIAVEEKSGSILRKQSRRNMVGWRAAMYQCCV